MKIAVMNEISAVDKNKDILTALKGRGHEIINAGMTCSGDKPELTYIHTGFLAALLLNLKKADLVVGGCGTGQGFLNSAMQYPGVFCGLIQNPLDAWLFGQINGGNCISLALNYGYGWAGDVNVKFIFNRLFSLEKFGQGYPPHRRESQQASRSMLQCISVKTHTPMANIISDLDDDIIQPVLKYVGDMDSITIDSMQDEEIKNALIKRR